MRCSTTPEPDWSVRKEGLHEKNTLQQSCGGARGYRRQDRDCRGHRGPAPRRTVSAVLHRHPAPHEQRGGGYDGLHAGAPL